MHPTLSLMRRFWRYQHAVRWRWAVIALLMCAAPVLSAGLLWAVKMLVDDVFVARQLDHLPFIVTIYVALVLAKSAGDYLLTRVQASAIEQIHQDVRIDLYRHASELSPGSQPQRSVGDLINHLSGDVERIEYLVLGGPLDVLVDIFSATLFAVVLCAISWQLTLCIAIIAPAVALLSWRMTPNIQRASRIARQTSGSWTAFAEERLGASTILQIYDAVADQTARFARRCRSARRAELRAIRLQANMSLAVELVIAVGGLALLVVGAYGIQRGALSVGELIAFLGSVGSLIGPIKGLSKASSRFSRSRASAERILSILDTPSMIRDLPGATDIANVAGAVSFHNVSFSYGDGPEVLRKISFAVKPGETVAIVGASGSGKSSLIKLLLRLYDPQSGSVMIDGRDVRSITLSSLRRAAAAIFQDSYVLSGSIAENISLGTESTPSEVAKAGQLAALDRFSKLAQGGYGAPVGPRGNWLSGGQRQRVALARAFVRNAPILVMDEATSALDSETEELMLEAITRQYGNRTTLVVAHRLSSIRCADRIIVLEQGEIVETGTPAELLSRNSRCRDLFSAQMNNSGLAA